MYNFILADLNVAEADIAKAGTTNKTLPSVGVVYVLKARLYMWVEDYVNAQSYAEKAIAAGSYTPLTRDQWLNTKTGFNTLATSSWMWGSHMLGDDDVVKNGRSVEHTSELQSPPSTSYAAYCL